MAYPLALGAITFFLAVIWGRPLINWLIRNEMGKKIRVEEPGAHQLKMGTPTMGGLMVIIPVVVITGALNIANLLGFNFIGQSVLIPLSTLVSFGLLGLIDDLEGIRGKRAKGEGIMARTKASWQVIFALIIALILYFGPTELRSVAIPGITDRIEIGLLWVPVAALIIVFTSNAVNLTDGLDGLAARWRRLPLPALALSPTCKARSGWQPSALRWLAHCWPSCGSTLTRPSCSWAMSARWLSVQPWQWSP